MAKTKESGEAKQSELPKTLKRSSAKAQRTFTKTYDAAIKEYDGDEERAYRTAYASLEKKYEKVDGKWKRKKDDEDKKKSDKKPKEMDGDKDSKKKPEKDKKPKDKKSESKKKSKDKESQHEDLKAKTEKKPKDKKSKDKKKSDKKDKDSKKSEKKVKKNKAEKPLSLKDEEYLESEPSLLDARSTKSEIDDFMEEDILDENLYSSADADNDPAPALETLRDIEDFQDSAYPEDELSDEDEQLIEELSKQEEQQSRQERQTTAFEVPGVSSSFTLENTTKRELYAEAVERNIAGRSTMNKEQLFEAVKQARA
ncbi:ChaB family protein [uncultured Rothia sp.]|uniref:ChaB family protein n=1 Tax=uncultured Rothia sp. TaxID=316088 RepID=UPI0032168A38